MIRTPLPDDQQFQSRLLAEQRRLALDHLHGLHVQIETRYVSVDGGGQFETQACQDGQLLELDRYPGRDAALEGHQHMVDRYRQATRTTCAACHRAWWVPAGLRCPGCGSGLSRG